MHAIDMKIWCMHLYNSCMLYKVGRYSVTLFLTN